jgi:hypothetical protein
MIPQTVIIGPIIRNGCTYAFLQILLSRNYVELKKPNQGKA